MRRLSFKLQSAIAALAVFAITVIAVVGGRPFFDSLTIPSSAKPTALERRFGPQLRALEDFARSDWPSRDAAVVDPLRDAARKKLGERPEIVGAWVELANDGSPSSSRSLVGSSEADLSGLERLKPTLAHGDVAKGSGPAGRCYVYRVLCEVAPHDRRTYTIAFDSIALDTVE